MGSPSEYVYWGALTGAAADITVTKVPFRPKSIEFFVDSAGSLEVGVKHESMAGAAYLSTTSGTDAGVTIRDDGFLLANGADVNVAAATVYYKAVG